MQTNPLRPRHLAAGGLEQKQQDATKQDWIWLLVAWKKQQDATKQHWKPKSPPPHGMVAEISNTHGVNDRPEFKNPTSNYKKPTSTHPV